MTKDEIINYWASSANKDLKAFESLFKNGHYIWALFLGHLILEKLLKAVYVKNIDTNIPYTHDLVKIADKAELLLTDKQKDLLDEITTFNIKARYPDYKGRFYKKITKRFAENYIVKIKELRQWLIKEIKK
ncbi:MAG: HEPN domain-containing protein [Nitrospinae bacterium]|nr:HEPN domain-containing protein [Nitrospinota bacterium]MBI3813841.1 HEPN domain-containing protein [Nitrospinota bacterium]